jgi:hypothetical protein
VEDREAHAIGGCEMSTILPWRRFWIPRDATPQPDVRGFFADPEAWYGKIANPDARTLEDLERTPCLVLLGEPGIGKSKTVEVYGDNTLTREPRCTLAVDLRIHRDLERTLFSTEKFRRWRAGHQHLLLIIDSLDEHRDGALEVAHRLLVELDGGPLEALRLRIACRTVQWPASVDEQLQRLWRGVMGDAVGFRTLAPLRRSDIADLFQAEIGGDPEAFFAEIERVNAAPLAIKPITLQFLLTEYREGRKLPDARRDLYERGCKKLCETSPSRHDAGFTGSLRVEHRLAVASRLAAVSILGCRGHILFGPDRGSTPSDVLRVEEVTGGTESSPLGEIDVTAAAVKEVLEVTGLFRSAEPGCARWAHQTYAEFLAARFLDRRGLTAEQIVREILCPSGHPIPALYETAAWLANLNKDLFQVLLSMHPETLLGSDFAMLADEDRAALVAALLERIDAREMLGTTLLYRRNAAERLRHRGLAAQLRPYIGDHTKYEMVRRVAIHMVEACKVDELYELLVDTALDPTDDIGIRSAAADAVASLGSRETRRRLKPLMSSEHDELKGHALQALWPDDLTPEQLFANLTPPKVKVYGGAYATFLRRLETDLTPATLPTALAWTAQLPSRHTPELYFGFRSLLNRVIAASWEHIDNPSVCMAFASAARHRLSLYDNIFDPRYMDDDDVPLFAQGDESRRLLVSALVKLGPIDRHGESNYAYYGLVQAQDTEWVVDRARCVTVDLERAQWFAILGELVVHNMNLNIFEVMNPAIGALMDIPDLREAMSWLPLCIELDSQEAEGLRADKERRAQREQAARERKGQIPSAATLIQECLDAFEKGDLNAGWRMQRWMSVDEDKGQEVSLSECYISDLPGWLCADEATRDRILRVARGYIIRCDDDAATWLGQNMMRDAVLAGYRYLLLLNKLDPAWLHERSAAIFRRWAAVVVAFSWDKDAKQDHELVTRAYRVVPDRVLSILSVLLDKEHEAHDYPRTLSRMQNCWDERFGHFVLDLARRPDLKPSFLRELLGEAIAHKVVGAVPYARSLLAPLGFPGTRDRLRSEAAAHSLLVHDLDAGWSAVLGAIREDSAFGCAIFLSLARSQETRHSGAWGGSIPTDEAAELYLWLESQFPRQDVPPGAHVITPQEMLDNLKNVLLNGLVGRGTPAAVAAIERISRALPGRDWTWELLHVSDIAAEKSWVPLSPRAVIDLRRIRGPVTLIHGHPFRLYISCAPEDELHCMQLNRHLSSARREGLVSVSSARDIGAGEDVRLASRKVLNRADIIVLLVSANYIDSDYCMDVEMPLAAERHQQGGARTVIVAVSPVDRGTLFDQFPVLPRGGEPVTRWVSADDAWTDVVASILDFAPACQ